MYDLLITNGTIVDGTGKAPFKADVAIQGDTIVMIGDLADHGAYRRLDARGKIVSPGFVDMHSHADYTLPVTGADSLALQGVTTAVVGQCGMSPSPLLPATRKEVIANTHTPGNARLLWDQWDDFGSFSKVLKDKGLSINLVSLVGQGTLRAGAMGFADGPAKATQMDAMRHQLETAMDQGAIGVSSGLIYPPGSFTSTQELISLMAPVARRNGFYFSHIRGEGDSLVEAVSEAIQIGRETGVKVQISHLKACWPKNWELLETALALIQSAIDEGLDVAADVYPYVAASTGLDNQIPDWAHEGGKEKLLRRLGNPEDRQAMTRAIQSEWDGSWDKVLISRCPASPAYEGQTVWDLAAAAGKTCEDWVYDALMATDLDISTVLFLASESNLEKVLVHPAVTIGSDGYAFGGPDFSAWGLPHPRNFGTFPRVLGRYVREKKVLSLPAAVAKMSGQSARRLGLRDRGRIAKGLRADVVVFDPQRVGDTATFSAPCQPPTGIDHVLVNGQCTVFNQEATGHLPGRAVNPLTP